MQRYGNRPDILIRPNGQTEVFDRSAPVAVPAEARGGDSWPHAVPTGSRERRVQPRVPQGQVRGRLFDLLE